MKTISALSIRYLEKKDIAEVVDLHQKTIQSPGSLIGPLYLRSIYTSFFYDPSLGFGMVAQKENTLIGIILAVSDGEKFGNMRTVISHPLVLLSLISSIISGKIRVEQLLKHRLFQKSVRSSYQKPYLSIQALAVDSSVLRMGIGKRLVGEVLKKAKEQHIPRVYVDTLKTNTSAQAFYTSVGFQRVKEAGDSMLYCLEV